MDKVSNNIKVEFDSKSIFNKTFLKTKVKSYNDEATDFHDKEMPKVGPNYYYFLSIWVFFHKHSRFTGQQEKGEAISLSPHYNSHSL